METRDAVHNAYSMCFLTILPFVKINCILSSFCQNICVLVLYEQFVI